MPMRYCNSLPLHYNTNAGARSSNCRLKLLHCSNMSLARAIKTTQHCSNACAPAAGVTRRLHSSHLLSATTVTIYSMLFRNTLTSCGTVQHLTPACRQQRCDRCRAFAAAARTACSRRGLERSAASSQMNFCLHISVPLKKLCSLRGTL